MASIRAWALCREGGMALVKSSQVPTVSHLLGSACAHACERRLMGGVGRAWRVCPTHDLFQRLECWSLLGPAGEATRLPPVPSFPPRAVGWTKNGGGQGARLATTTHHVFGGFHE